MRLLFWSPRSRTACRDECFLTKRGNLSFHGRPPLAITLASHGKLQAPYPFPPTRLLPEGSRPLSPWRRERTQTPSPVLERAWGAEAGAKTAQAGTGLPVL